MKSHIQKYILVFAGLIITVINGKTPSLTVEVDSGDGSYRLKVEGQTWLEGAPPFFYVDGTRYSVDDGNLIFINVTQSTGQETGLLGPYISRDITYRANNTYIVASARSYAYGVIKFLVTYIDGANGTRGYNEWETISGFPGFKMESVSVPLGYLTYSDKQIETVHAGRWNASAVIHDSLEGSGPVALFDHGGRCLVTSQADNFMVASNWRDQTSNRLYWGIIGSIDEVPVNFTYSTVVAFGHGIRQTFGVWGIVLKTFIYYNTTTTYPPQRLGQLDPVADYLGYWTSIGAAYHDSPAPGKTYVETIKDVFKYSVDNQLAYRSLQMDEWWYIKDADGHIKNWSPSPTTLPNGLQPLQADTGMDFIAYAGLWSADNVYSNFSFVVENNIALPTEQTFWDILFEKAASWGITAFLQDKLSETFLSMNSTKSDIYLASNWLQQMSTAAYHNNITIIYNDPYPRQVLQTLLSPDVTQIGIKNGVSSMGLTSILLASLKLKPMFRVVTTKKSSSNLMDPKLQEVLAILSGGSVGIGDAVGITDYELLKRCCDNQGTVLRPALLPMAVNSQIIQAAFQDGSGPNGQIWSTYSSITTDRPNAYLPYATIFANNVDGEFNMTPSSLDLDWSIKNFPRSKIYSAMDATKFTDFDENNPVALKNCDQNFCLYHTAPVFKFKSNEFVILGDLTKWIPMTRTRFLEITNLNYVSVRVMAAPKEIVHVSVLVNDKLMVYNVTCDENGTGAIIFDSFPTEEPRSTTPQPVDSSSSLSVSFVCLAVMFVSLSVS